MVGVRGQVDFAAVAYEGIAIRKAGVAVVYWNRARAARADSNRVGRRAGLTATATVLQARGEKCFTTVGDLVVAIAISAEARYRAIAGRTCCRAIAGTTDIIAGSAVSRVCCCIGFAAIRIFGIAVVKSAVARANSTDRIQTSRCRVGSNTFSATGTTVSNITCCSCLAAIADITVAIAETRGASDTAGARGAAGRAVA